MGNLKVFVYGTLKPEECNYERYCAKKVVEAKRAIALGQLFALPVGYPAMTVGDATVHGFLLAFADIGVLQNLDRLEDYYPSRPATENEYIRSQIQTYKPGGQPLDKAWAYLMTPEQVCRRQGVLLSAGLWGGK